ncbi:hypothetical protein HAX54_050636, partial [Datura stramonium]|nr:hypothetical protein [Datura stramonium]
AYRNNEEEEHLYQISDMEKLILEHMKVMREQVDVDVEEVDKSEDVNHNSILELGCIGPHSKHFSKLCMVENLEIEPLKHMERCVDEEQFPYIPKIFMPKRHNYIPQLRAKKY